MGQIGVLLTLVLTAAFGGLDTVDDHVTAVQPGKPFDDGPFSVTVDRARLVAQVSAGNRVVLPPQAGRSYLAVVARLDSKGTIPQRLMDELDLVGVADAKWIKAMRIADSTGTFWQGPELTDQLAFIWDVPEHAVRQGDSVTVRIWKKQFTELKVTYGRAWIDSLTDYAQIHVPVAGPVTMKPPSQRMRSMTGTAAAVSSIVAAAVIFNNLPTTTDIYAPFDVTGVPGHAVQGRNLNVTLTAARITDEVAANSVLTPRPVSAVGQWILVDATILAVVDPATPRAELIAGPNTYRPTDRLPPGTTLGGPLQPGIDQSGSWAFDVSPSLLEPVDTVTLHVWDGDGRLDSRLEIQLPLNDSIVSRPSVTDLARPVRGHA